MTLGVLPGTGGTQRLARMVGKCKAIELMVTGETFDFEEARQLGIVNQICEAATQRRVHREGARSTPSRSARPNKAAKAVGRIKRAVQTGAELPLESALALERELQQQLFQSEDAKEGLGAYVEKRKANFKGAYPRPQTLNAPVRSPPSGGARLCWAGASLVSASYESWTRQ